jgi:hypothetical protein
MLSLPSRYAKWKDWPSDIIMDPILGVSSTLGDAHCFHMAEADWKARNNVATTWDVSRVDKAKRFFVGHWRKVQAIKTCIYPTLLDRNVLYALEPSHPKEINLSCLIIEHAGTGVDNIDMEYSEHTSIYVLMLGRARFLARQEHDIAMVGVGIDGVLGSPHIIGRVVDPHHVMTIHSVGFEMDPIQCKDVVNMWGTRTRMETVVSQHLGMQHGSDMR